ncbi:helix-turn-helix domain-containing protein [Deefgea rivuli]|uniref:helix-turn-helix domain-containing protein n=1 Tax=Deefgea rivuli TaxID=400948 RepID=UPI0006881E19|nr:AraC family transcriptional regulator [Deefgea rivuli]
MLVKEWIAPTPGQSWQYFYSADHLCPFQWHYHPEFELTFTQNARGMRYVGGDAAEFGALDLVLVAPNQPHTWQAATNIDGSLQTVQVAFFTLEWLQTLAAQGAPELLPLSRWLAQIRQGVVFGAAMAQTLQPKFTELHHARGLARLMCLLDILCQLQHDPDLRLLQGQAVAQIQDTRLASALHYLQQHYTEAITLDDLARVAKASSATVKRLLAVQMQTNFSALLAQLRIGHACNLLHATTLPIPALAQASGFPSLSQFYRKFTELKNTSPASYRKNLSNQTLLPQ